MKIKIALIVSILISSVQVYAARADVRTSQKKDAKASVQKGRRPAQQNDQVNNEVPCKPVAWPFERNASLSDLRMRFGYLTRYSLIRMAWSELLYPRPDSVAIPILHYLASTTDGVRKRAYFETIGALTLKDSTPTEAIKIWPRRPTMQPSPLRIEQLCSLYVKATRN